MVLLSRTDTSDKGGIRLSDKTMAHYCTRKSAFVKLNFYPIYLDRAIGRGTVQIHLADRDETGTFIFGNTWFDSEPLTKDILLLSQLQLKQGGYGIRGWRAKNGAGKDRDGWVVYAPQAELPFFFTIREEGRTQEQVTFLVKSKAQEFVNKHDILLESQA